MALDPERMLWLKKRTRAHVFSCKESARVKCPAGGDSTGARVLLFEREHACGMLVEQCARVQEEHMCSASRRAHVL